MRVLMLAFVGADQDGVLRKLSEQVNAMRQVAAFVTAIVVTDSRVAPLPDSPSVTFIDVPGGGFTEVSRAAAFAQVQQALLNQSVDVVYVRYPMYDAHLLRFVQEAPPVVLEIQTKFDRELPTSEGLRENLWASKVLPYVSGLVAVTPEILRYETLRAQREIPGHVMSNGADPARIPFTPPQHDLRDVHLLCVATFYPWHGVDRIIGGMAAEPDVNNVHLHLVGSGRDLTAIGEMANDLNVGGRVHLHGSVAPEALGPFFAQAHLGIGVLAPHRKDLHELSALKHREYALRGLPFIAAGVDVDFPATLPWVRTVASDDTLLSPRQVRAFALSWSSVRRRQQIRAWAEAELSWDKRMPSLITFFERCASNRATVANVA